MCSVVEIQQLACRYAGAVDARDLDLLVSLFVPDVAIGREARGRDALRRWYGRALRTVGPTIHVVANHVVDLEGDRATGVAYCREEVRGRDSDEWRTGMLQYRDAYRRVDGRWLFERRRVARWYAAEAPGQPSGDQLGGAAGLGPRDLPLPESFPTWSAFWADPDLDDP